jgi:hypothetical protein
MLSATDTSVRELGAPDGLPAPASPGRSGTPEWHSLRLFGRGRHPGAFTAGAETQAEL